MKTPSPEKNVRRYRQQGLPDSKQQFDDQGYRKMWHRVGQQLRGKQK